LNPFGGEIRMIQRYTRLSLALRIHDLLFPALIDRDLKPNQAPSTINGTRERVNPTIPLTHTQC
jgi:hypothetical protein